MIATMTESVADIRPYVAADKEECRTLVAQLQDAGRLIDSRLRRGEEMADEYLEQMHARCRDYAGIILVAQAADGIVGLVMMLGRVPFTSLDAPPGDYALIAELVVRDDWRRRGVGAALLRAGEAHAHKVGASELRIDVLSGNRAARQLYAREGFLPHLETLSKPL
jgi:GNAT superfamily N-acetyltransferase